MFIDIPSGEKIQQLAELYLGYHYDFVYNPLIENQPSKWCYIDSIPEIWNNPSLLFCYSHRVEDLSKKLSSFQNSCVVLFTNSDQNMSYELCKPFLDSDKIKHIFCQNIGFLHPKASWLPIGIANKQWPHGDPVYLESVNRYTLQKLNHIFCSFSVSTNTTVREKCLQSIQSFGIENKSYSSQSDYIDVLSQHCYAICPEGNGLDTHRFWECLFVQTIPIVIRNPLTEQIHADGLPCILIDSWETFNPSNLPDYSSFLFDESFYYKISFTRFYNDILMKNNI